MNFKIKISFNAKLIYLKINLKLVIHLCCFNPCYIGSIFKNDTNELMSIIVKFTLYVILIQQN